MGAPNEELMPVASYLEAVRMAMHEEMERDEREGRLDALIDQALEEHQAGRTRPL